MSNNCAIDIKITGREVAVRELVQMLRREGPFANMGLGRVFNFALDESMTQHHPEDPSIISVQGCGDCANSIKSALIDARPFNLLTECKRLQLVLEAFSSEPGGRFQEHFLCNKGIVEQDKSVYYEEWIPANMALEDIEWLAQENGLSVSELMSRVNDNGEFLIGGFDNYCDFEDLFRHFDPAQTLKFIPDGELVVCFDTRHECVSLFLRPEESLLAACREQFLKTMTEAEFSDLQGIRFYAEMDPQRRNVTLFAEGYVVVQFYGRRISLSEDNAHRLMAFMEERCRTDHGQSCIEAVNQFRKQNDMLTVAQMDILVEKLKTASTLEYKGINFDDWVYNEELGNIYGEMCQDCAEQYKDLLSDEMDDGGIAAGACSVKGCSNTGDDPEKNHYYVDFKPALIKVVERKPSLDQQCIDADARREGPQAGAQTSGKGKQPGRS